MGTVLVTTPAHPDRRQSKRVEVADRAPPAQPQQPKP